MSRPAFDARFQNYLDEMTWPEGSFSTKHIAQVRTLWRLLAGAFGASPLLPIALPTECGALQLAWTRRRYHVSVNIYEDCWDWFFRSRATLEYDGDEVADFTHIPPALEERLALLLG